MKKLVLLIKTEGKTEEEIKKEVITQFTKKSQKKSWVIEKQQTGGMIIPIGGTWKK